MHLYKNDHKSYAAKQDICFSQNKDVLSLYVGEFGVVKGGTSRYFEKCGRKSNARGNPAKEMERFKWPFIIISAIYINNKYSNILSAHVQGIMLSLYIN